MNILKIAAFALLLFKVSGVNAQNIQLHYDFRHTLDPDINPRNFPSISFEYFKQMDSLGSFLFKLQSDLNGSSGNIGQTFIQLSQTLRFWQPPVYLSFNYSGGLGVAPPAYGYYLPNAFGIGVSYPFQWNGAFFSLNSQYRYTALDIPSHDIQLTFWFGRGFFNYKIWVAGTIVAWTQDAVGVPSDTSATKEIAFFGDPQIWVKVKGKLSMGTRVNLLYNLIGDGLKVYPTLGTQFKF